MLTVTNMPLILSVIMLNVIMMSVVMLNVVAPSKQHSSLFVSNEEKTSIAITPGVKRRPAAKNSFFFNENFEFFLQKTKFQLDNLILSLNLFNRFTLISFFLENSALNFED